MPTFAWRAIPDYRKADQVELAEVVWHVIEEAVVEMNRYRAGELHITETIPPGRLDWLREQLLARNSGLRPTWAVFFWPSTLSASRLPTSQVCAER